MKIKPILRDAAVLCLITFVAGAGVSSVYRLTNSVIQNREVAQNQEKYQKIFPDASDFQPIPWLDSYDPAVGDGRFGDVKINQLIAAVDNQGKEIGFIIVVTSEDAFYGPVQAGIGIFPDNTVSAVQVFELNDTPNLGMKVAEPDFLNQFSEKKVETFKVVTTGVSADYEIDSVSGATITSTAVTNAVNGAIYFKEHIWKEENK